MVAGQRLLIRHLQLLLRHRGPSDAEGPAVCLELRRDAGEGLVGELVCAVSSRKAPFEAEFLGCRVALVQAAQPEGAELLLELQSAEDRLIPCVETEEQIARRLLSLHPGPWRAFKRSVIARHGLHGLFVGMAEEVLLADLESQEAAWRAMQQALRAARRLQGFPARRRVRRRRPALQILQEVGAPAAAGAADQPAGGDSDTTAESSDGESWPAGDDVAAVAEQAGSSFGWLALRRSAFLLWERQFSFFLVLHQVPRGGRGQWRVGWVPARRAPAGRRHRRPRRTRSSRSQLCSLPARARLLLLAAEWPEQWCGELISWHLFTCEGRWSVPAQHVGGT